MTRRYQGELKNINPSRLYNDGSPDIDNFFLTLGLIYNDLKGLVSLSECFYKDYEPHVQDEISVHNGNHVGQTFHLHRLYVGHIHEFLKFLETKHVIFSTHEFQEILRRIPHGPRSLWIDIQSTAIGAAPTATASSFAKTLLIVRNNVSYHYYQSEKILRQGFNKFFLTNKGAVGSETAYYAIGENMASTRFFYVDAAVREYLVGEVAKNYTGTELSPNALFTAHMQDVREMISAMNTCLAHIMRQYLKTRPHRD